MDVKPQYTPAGCARSTHSAHAYSSAHRPSCSAHAYCTHSTHSGTHTAHMVPLYREQLLSFRIAHELRIIELLTLGWTLWERCSSVRPQAPQHPALCPTLGVGRWGSGRGLQRQSGQVAPSSPGAGIQVSKIGSEQVHFCREAIKKVAERERDGEGDRLGVGKDPRGGGPGVEHWI